MGRGVYLPTAEHVPRDVALAWIVAVDERLRAEHCFSHESAALVWGLPLWRLPSAVHVRTETHGGSGSDRSVRRHHAATPSELMTQVNGLPVTCLALTALDCARTLPPLDALVVLDAALRAGLDHDEFLTLLDTLPERRGTRRARLLLRHADGGAESPQETASRFHLLRAGAPTPTTQVQVGTPEGTYWVDLGIGPWRLLVEYDGRDKYTSPDVVYAEKHRQDAITAATRCEMLRVTTVRGFDRLVTDALAHAPAGWRPIPRPELNR